jgi:hypothetical protein
VAIIAGAAAVLLVIALVVVLVLDRKEEGDPSAREKTEQSETTADKGEQSETDSDKAEQSDNGADKGEQSETDQAETDEPKANQAGDPGLCEELMAYPMDLEDAEGWMEFVLSVAPADIAEVARQAAKDYEESYTGAVDMDRLREYREAQAPLIDWYTEQLLACG